MGRLLMAKNPPTCSDETMTYQASLSKVTFSNKQDYMLVKQTTDIFIELLEKIEKEE